MTYTVGVLVGGSLSCDGDGPESDTERNDVVELLELAIRRTRRQGGIGADAPCGRHRQSGPAT